MNYIMFFGIIGVASAALGAFFYWYQSKFASKSAGIALFETLREESLKIQEKKLLAIKKEFNIPDNAWKAYWDGFYHYVYADDLFEPVTYHVEKNDRLETLFKSILLEYGVNPKRVKLVMVKNNPDHDDAKSVQNIDENDRIVHEVEINYQTFKESDQGVNEVILRHEIMHLICYDSLALLYLYNLLMDFGYTKDQVFNAPSVIAYNHEMELRADRLSLYRNKALAEYALEMYQWAEQTIKNEKLNDISISHPTYQQRAQEIKKLIKRIR